MTAGRSSFEAHWTRLLGRPPSSITGFRVHELAHETPWGSVTLAVDAEAVRHLLVPILSSTRVRTGLDGPGLALRKRVLEDRDSHTTYADLSCLRHELDYLFDDLCGDVLDELADLEEQPLRAVYQVVDRWRSLFDRPVGVLSDEAAAGLYGELLVLRRLLQNDASAHRTWTGPSGAHHDFMGGTINVEVKATTSPDGRSVQIHGLGQLEEPAAGRLMLAWFRLVDTRAAGTGTTLGELAGETLALADDVPALRGLFAQVGYVPGAVEANDSRRYSLGDERWYEVKDAFPRLTRAVLDRAGVPETVGGVSYVVDLTAEPPTPLDVNTVARHLDELTGTNA